MAIRNAARAGPRDYVQCAAMGQPRLVAVDWLERELPDPEDQRKYAQERVRVAVTEAIAGAMEYAGMRRVDVAESLGMNKSQVTQLLSGRRNMTLRTLGDLLWSCGLEVEDLKLGPLGQIACDPAQAWEWLASGTPCVPSESTRQVVFEHAATGSERAADNYKSDAPMVPVRKVAAPMEPVDVTTSPDLCRAA